MKTKKKADGETGPKRFRGLILARVARAFKAAIVTATLWHLLPYGLAEWLIRRLRLGGA